jgi:dTDP-4-amino-4,6-dideoxygalactose transaminase
VTATALERLAAVGIQARRYFFPSLNRLSYLSTTNSCPISEDIAVRVVCLPMSADVTPAVQHRVADILLEAAAHPRLVADL